MSRATVLLVVGAHLLACRSERAPREVFEEDVAPILVQRCGASVCHGVAPGAEEAGDVIVWDRFFFRIDADGDAASMDALYAATRRLINTDEDPAFSTLLLKVMPRAYGGLGHHGGAAFTSEHDPAYRTILTWIASEEDGGESEPPLSALEQRFANEVQPVLLGASCAATNCHGSGSAVPYHLLPAVGDAVPRAWTRQNYTQSVRMITLDGAPDQSRLLRKALPLHAGGIVHKGGNSTFLTGASDPRVDALRSWACAERQAAVGQPCDDAQPSPSWVFVRGALAPHGVFELDSFAPGTDILLAGSLEDPSPENLTEALTPEPADARDPALDPTGTRMLFALRERADRGHSIWAMDLASREATRLTEPGTPLSGGGLITDRDPTFGPDGHVWFVSTRDGLLANDGAALDAELYELDTATGEAVRRTYTPHRERKPVFFALGKVGGEVAFTALRDLYDDQTHAHPFRFPPDLRFEYHQHFGTTPAESLFYDMRELPDGRYVCTIGEVDAVWGAGDLGVVDRNFGPEDDGAASPGLPFYAEPLVRLGVRGLFTMPGALCRDPVALPDGRLLASCADGAGAADATAVPDFRVELLTLAEQPDGTGPAVVGRQVLADAPGVADRDPEPVVVRRPIPKSAETYWDPSAPEGLLLHQGLPIIDALITRLPPSGAKPIRDDMCYVRLVESVPVPAGQGAPSLGLPGRARILAELPLAADGSFQVRIPAGVPFRIQGLSEDRVAVGTAHNRWFYVMGGQTLPQGVRTDPSTIYRQQCAACHGGLSGDPADVFAGVDAVTMASVTLARFADGNPRRPLDPPTVGDSTRLEIDFARDVQPILDAACATAGCHATGAAVPELAAAPAEPPFTRAYTNLLAGGWVVAGQAGASPLLTLLDGAPPHATLTEEERLTLVRWIDLGAGFVGVAP